jgi:F0F1-type ATP synthase membrane subunit b/b'
MKNVFRWYIIVLMLLLLALVIVAGLDYWAIRKYGMRHLEQIKSDRRAMIEQELAELRKAKENRNGRG